MGDDEGTADESRLKGRTEPPPEARSSSLGSPYSSPVPFGEPPSEPVEIVGEVPWELREGDGEDDDSEDEKDS